MDVLLRVLLSLSALAGIHSITTVSQVLVRAGGSITIPCLYESKYTNHVKYLCKGYYWNSCSDVIKTNHKINKRFSISDDKIQKIFTVTIKDLTEKDTDYWCAVEINGGGDERKYFKLSVTTKTSSLDISNQEITGSIGSPIAIDCNSGEMKWCRLGRSCLTKSGSIDGTGFTISASVAGGFTVTMSELSKESSGWYWCVKGDLQMPVHITVTGNNPYNNGQDATVPVDLNAYIIPLSLLIFIVLVTVFIWFMLKRHKQTKEAASAVTAAEEEITYSTVTHKRNTSSQVEANYENVTYSTLA
ncbi:polymeric immunoglobulin receptor-like [Pseudochaenichthys georgianus]|uniref:polymeric immunoglobulin receptor-like n=1 Tax=Pseudochaenichthys georgianus TaxID=52239 RepID=UPI00146B3EDF|nr:polymeric immunoglobulin receptor-like [Pseudochaenichthys georgianus]